MYQGKLNQHLKIGQLGEDKAVEYLKNNQFIIKDRNYSCLSGELDIVATKNGKVYFFEVKTTQSYSTIDDWQAEDNLHQAKLKKIFKSIACYLSDKRISDREWQLDALAVYLNQAGGVLKINHLEDIF